MTVTLTTEQERILRDTVRSGRFASVEEALDAALRMIAPIREASHPSDGDLTHPRDVRDENILPDGGTVQDLIDEGRV